jgi:hypothetical protein
MSAQSRWTILMVKNETVAQPGDAANRGPPHDKAEGKIRNYETSRARPRPPSLILFSLGDCDGHLSVHRPALARQTLIETKTGAAVEIFSPTGQE